MKKYCVEDAKKPLEEHIRAFLELPALAEGEHTPMEMILGYKPKVVLDLVNIRNNRRKVTFKEPIVEESRK